MVPVTSVPLPVLLVLQPTLALAPHTVLTPLALLALMVHTAPLVLLVLTVRTPALALLLTPLAHTVAIFVCSTLSLD